MSTTNQNTLSLIAVMVQDKKIGGFTAFFKQFPDILAEGKTEEIALRNLINALHDVLYFKSRQNDVPINDPSMKVIERSVNFQEVA